MHLVLWIFLFFIRSPGVIGNINTTQLPMDLPNFTALFTDPDQKAPVITKQHLKSEIYEAYRASQHQLKQAREELLPAGILGGLISLLLVGALLI